MLALSPHFNEDSENSSMDLSGKEEDGYAPLTAQESDLSFAKLLLDLRNSSNDSTPSRPGISQGPPLSPVGVTSGDFDYNQIARSAVEYSPHQRGRRRRYKCSRCGKEKVNHLCTISDQRFVVKSTASQTIFGPIVVTEAMKTITVRRPMV